MDSGFRRRETATNEVRLSYQENDGDGPAEMALHGHATRRPADVSRDAFTADAAAVIRQVSPGRPVTLVGQSMGGHTAILAAAERAEFVAARPGTRHVILADGSHDAHLDATPESAAALSVALEG